MGISLETLEKIARTAQVDHALRIHPIQCEDTFILDKFGHDWTQGIPGKPVVVEVLPFDKPDKWGSSYAVTIEYSRNGFQAIYGVKKDGTFELYQD